MRSSPWTAALGGCASDSRQETGVHPEAEVGPTQTDTDSSPDLLVSHALTRGVKEHPDNR